MPMPGDMAASMTAIADRCQVIAANMAAWPKKCRPPRRSDPAGVDRQPDEPGGAQGEQRHQSEGGNDRNQTGPGHGGHHQQHHDSHDQMEGVRDPLPGILGSGQLVDAPERAPGEQQQQADELHRRICDREHDFLSLGAERRARGRHGTAPTKGVGCGAPKVPGRRNSARSRTRPTQVPFARWTRQTQQKTRGVPPCPLSWTARSPRSRWAISCSTCPSARRARRGSTTRLS